MITQRTAAHADGAALRHAGLEMTSVSIHYPPEFYTLGSGYDLFGQYAFAGSVKQRIFAWEHAKTVPRDMYQVPELITATPVQGTESHLFWGESALKLQSTFSTSVSIGFSLPGLFSASITSEFSTSTLRKSRQVYSIYQIILPLWKYSFDYKSETAKRMMTNDFKQAIQSYPPNDLFDIYGTHFLHQIIIGGRLHFSSVTKSAYYANSTEFETSVKGSCELDIGTLEASASVSTTNAIQSFNTNSETHLHSLGGDPALAEMLGKGKDANENNAYFKAWLESVRECPVLVDFGDHNKPFIPIWELTDDPKRRAELESAVETYLNERDQRERLYADRLVGVEIIHDPSSGNIQAPSGYIKDPYDLNKGAGGDFIFLCTAYQPVDEIKRQKIRPITGLKVIDIHGGVPQGWELINVDLNKGAGGADLYLCKQYGEPGQIDGTIRDVVVVGGKGGHQPAPFGYKQLEYDVNLRSGGDFIYICYATED